jgi:hypothetical protein
MGAAGDIWTSVDRLVDAAESIDDLRRHRLHLLAARRWRALGRDVPAELTLDERRSVATAVAAPALLRRVREAAQGPMLVLKGPEIAARYPDAVLRGYSDIDLLVPDPVATQCELLAAGFVAIGDPRIYAGIHHVRPLAWPALPVPIELHSGPKWPDGFVAPSPAELLEGAVPSSLAVPGVSTLDPAHHALVVAAHSWAHDPLRRVGELLDVTVMALDAEPSALRTLARRWGLRRIWDTTLAASDSLFQDGRPRWPLRTWARHLPAVRDRTVLETHLERWLSGFWAWPAGRAATRLGSTLVRELVPSRGETMRAKAARTRLAARNARLAAARHAEEVEQAGIRAPIFYELDEREDAERPSPRKPGR